MDRTVIKVRVGAALRRVGLAPPVTLRAVQAAVAALLGAAPADLQLQWRDDEGDLVALDSPAELAEALACAADRPLRIEACIAAGRGPTSASSASPVQAAATRSVLEAMLQQHVAARRRAPSPPVAMCAERREAARAAVEAMLTRRRRTVGWQAAAAAVEDMLSRRQHAAGRDAARRACMRAVTLRTAAPHHVACTSCATGIAGVRFTCDKCRVDLCSRCEPTHLVHPLVARRVPQPQPSIRPPPPPPQAPARADFSLLSLHDIVARGAARVAQRRLQQRAPSPGSVEAAAAAPPPSVLAVHRRVCAESAARVRAATFSRCMAQVRCVGRLHELEREAAAAAARAHQAAEEAAALAHQRDQLAQATAAF